MDIPGPSYSDQKNAFRAALTEFLESYKGAQAFVRFLAATTLYWPNYRATGELVSGIHKSDMFLIMQELGIPGDYPSLIAKAKAFEESLGK